jgi:hypothetical protein
MFGYSTRMKLDSYCLKAVPNKCPPSKDPPSKRPPNKHQVFHALMSCFFDPDPDPDPDQVALSGTNPSFRP